MKQELTHISLPKLSLPHYLLPKLLLGKEKPKQIFYEIVSPSRSLGSRDNTLTL